MKNRVLSSLIVGMVVASSFAAVQCGGDDTGESPGVGGKSGSTGTAGATGTGGGASGQGGTTGGGTSGAAGQGGTTGTSGAAGQGGTAGTSGGAGQGGGDASTPDAAKPDASSDGSITDGSTKLVAFQSVVDILTAQCTGCHKSNDGSVTGLVDFQTETGLYARLTSPLPSGQEGQCGFSDAGTDGGDAAVANRTLVVAGDTANSFLYLKILGTQPTGCGTRMPRTKVTLEDGGSTTVACDLADGGAANCLTPEQANTIRDWIAQGAHELAADN